VTGAKCAVTWCVWPDCTGDHYAGPGEGDWPAVQATAYAPDGPEHVFVSPTWGQQDGLAPAVNLWLHRVSPTGVDLLSEAVDLTPDEADALAANLLRAAEAARKTNTNTNPNGER